MVLPVGVQVCEYGVGIIPGMDRMQAPDVSSRRAPCNLSDCIALTPGAGICVPQSGYNLVSYRIGDLPLCRIVFFALLWLCCSG